MFYILNFVFLLEILVKIQVGYCVVTPVVCDVTNKEGPEKNKPCVFPFKFKGKLYKNCTNDVDPNDKFWCSTKVDEDDKHITGQGNFGYCDERCAFERIERMDDAVNFQHDASTQHTEDIGSPQIEPAVRDPQGTIHDEDALDFSDHNEGVTKINRPLTTTTQVTEGVAKTNRPLTTTTQAADYEEDYKDDYSDRPSYETSRTADGTWLPDPSTKSTCGVDTSVGFIVGGKDAKAGEFPFMAALGKVNKNNKLIFVCGGSLINRRYVLTAAHCNTLKSQTTSNISRVILGMTDFSVFINGEIDPSIPKLQVFNIRPTDIIQHKDFLPSRPEAGNDVAIIRLPRAVTTIHENPTDSYILPVCLGWNSDIKMPDARFRQALTLGWGKTSNLDPGDLPDLGVYSTKLQKVDVPIIPAAECRRRLFHRFPVYNDQHTCAGDEGHDSCAGDSGGPLIVRSDRQSPAFLLGITSFGISKCGTGVPGVYTRVDTFMPWILSKLER